ncbi:defensin protein [Salix suchowensis]|nr:defensin protein [Salix suchowensis]
METRLLFLASRVCFPCLTSFLKRTSQIKWCPKKATFPGGCGNNGSQQCLVDFLSNYGASSMPKNCVCKNAGFQRLCSCDVVCQ